jgi:uncharacterized protein YecT (DUF1311 family)
MRNIFIAFLLCISNSAFAQEEPTPHPIDIWLQQSLEKDYTTMGMREAMNTAREKWDQEMNQIYIRLMSRLNKEQKASLRESQRAWLKFRDAEGKVISNIIASKEGTMWQLTATNKGMELVRARALQLKEYEDALGE